jgi:hypothetical protein
MRKQLALVTMLGLACTAHAGNNNDNKQQQSQDQKRHVDLVIALDISGSMDGLIDSARQKLWDVVNLLAQAKPTPTLRVGLISYGSPAYPAQSGYVNIESDLTTDLDSIYSKLFALRTNGGDEYVARAVQTGTRQMKWTQDQNALKIIFVAGNEPANQDPQVAVETAVNEAKEKHIFVNTIYCGYETAGEAVGWRQVATLGGGKFAAIDQNHTVAIATPMDAELDRLSGELNKTYVAYGVDGGRRAANQAAQDKNAQGAGGSVAASRAIAKSSPLYSNDEWDLVDAKKKGKKIAEMPVTALPPAVAAMPAEKREEFVAGKAKEREKIQKQISELNNKREAFIKTERAKKKPAGKDLNDALSGDVREEAVKSGFAF